MNLTILLGYLWSGLLLGGWTYLTIEFVRAGITGRYSFLGRRVGGRKWLPVRAEQPVQFWLVWCLTAGPFLLLTSLVLVGFGMMMFQR